MQNSDDFLTVKDASVWACQHTNREVTTSNISYLIQYGRIKKHEKNGIVLISKNELEKYYNITNGYRESTWKEILGKDLNWALSFEKYKEAETTKHVHRLHPYKGKFIPQLVEYFIDNHTDQFKRDIFFNKGDIILDPFCGSGTTLVQCSELGINAIGIDVSAFNSLISNCKILKYDIAELNFLLKGITSKLKEFISLRNEYKFENELLEELSKFNNTYFPVPDYKYKLKRGEIDEGLYSSIQEKLFLPIYYNLIAKYKIKVLQHDNNSFLGKWYLNNVRDEINFVFEEIKKIRDSKYKKIISIILSRTIRSCRATTHSDLATLVDPVSETYYCKKHGKICKPLFSILKWWESYTKDTIKRIAEFDRLRTNTFQYCLTGDSRTINIREELNKVFPNIDLLETKEIDGIFSSPPYVGLIDYHRQHAYSYELFGFPQNEECEIGPLFKGQGREAQQAYIEGISQVLKNSLTFLKNDCNILLVANDKFNIYPEIASKSGLKIVNQFKRPVLNRTEKDKGAYSEIIFHLKRL